VFKPVTVAFLLSLVLSCAPEKVTRAKWEAMSPEDRSTYVSSLMGAEQAKHAKGGQGKALDRPAMDYVARIDEAYAHGDQRDAEAIFAEVTR
jgi:hypothetical protein